MIYFKLTTRTDKPIHQNTDIVYQKGKTYTAELDESAEECASGIYFCDYSQLLLWHGDYNIWEVEPIGKIVKVAKGYRTDKLKMMRKLTKKQYDEILMPYGVNYDGDSMTSGDGGRRSQELLYQPSGQYYLTVLVDNMIVI